MSTQPISAPFGSWKSPITTDLIVGATISFAETRVSNKFVYHSETRPSEGGRSVIVRTALGGDGKGKDVFGEGWNARTRVHEYGGGAFVVVPDTDEVLFSNVKDGRIWRVAKDSTEPVAITAESTTHRFAAFQPHPLFSTTHPYLLSVLEEHEEPSLPSTVKNSLVLINAQTGILTSLRASTDFYSSCFWSPSSSSNNNKISWIEWDHPNMPWESSRLFVAELEGLEEGNAKVVEVTRVAGGKDPKGGKEETTLGQPTWVKGEDGEELFFLWDKTGYSLLYRWKVGGGEEPELMMEELKYDLSDPDWAFSLSRYTALTPTLFVLTPLIKSLTTLHLLHLPSKKLIPLAYSTQTSSPFVTVDGLRRISDTSFLFVGTTDSSPPALSVLDVTSGEVTTVKKSSEVDEKEVPKGMFSPAEGLEFDVPTGEGGKTVSMNALYFAPKNANYSGVDPWFNYRATKVLANDGFYEFWNWFDPTAWYPLGRVVGGTVYPGLMVTSGIIYNFLKLINIPVDIRNVCVMLAPAFSGLTAWATYLFTNELTPEGSYSAGLLAAAFIGIAPGYISRSVAGSYDNEAIAIFLLMFTFYLWIRALKQGSAFWGTIAALFYGYMVAAWGGYVFITNMLPLHAFVLVLMGRFTNRLYISYSSWYLIGTLASMQVPFVGFLPLKTSEHMAALGVFGLLQLVAFVQIVRSHLPAKQFQTLLTVFVVAVFAIAFAALVAMTMSGTIAPWTGRFYSLWDTGYAKIHIPIIASVSEHQPTAWPSFFFDLEMLIWIFPAGIFLCFQQLTDGHVFIIIYAALASYFAGVMVRLMLTLTPVVCVASALAVTQLLHTYIDPYTPEVEIEEGEPIRAIFSTPTTGTSTADTPPTPPSKKASKKAAATSSSSTKSTSSSRNGVFGIGPRLLVVGNLFILLVLFVLHCTWVTSNAYSSPSVVLSTRNNDGSQNIIDDFREAYYWLRMNTKEDAVVMSWWDYGYQIAGMADRPTLVDNNTWNNTHIATVGKAMSSSEEVSYPILKKHDVDYVLVIFGGLLGYSGDDINKFLWMVRIAQGVWPEEIQERDYFTSRGEYKVDKDASPAMKNSLMYKMSYFRFPELFGGQRTLDRVRNQDIPESPTLDVLDEAFTSENWIVRIYAVKPLDPLGRQHKAANKFAGGTRLKKASTAAPKLKRRATN